MGKPPAGYPRRFLARARGPAPALQAKINRFQSQILGRKTCLHVQISESRIDEPSFDSF
jgi:hypothetical protein